MWRASSATCTASSCSDLPEVRVDRARRTGPGRRARPARSRPGRSSPAPPRPRRRPAARTGASHGTAVCGSHWRGGGLGVQVGRDVGPDAGRGRPGRTGPAGPPASTQRARGRRAPTARAGGRSAPTAGPARPAPRRASGRRPPTRRTTHRDRSPRSPRSGHSTRWPPAATPGGQVDAPAPGRGRRPPADHRAAARRRARCTSRCAPRSKPEVAQGRRRDRAVTAVVRGRHPPVGVVEAAARRPPPRAARSPSVPALPPRRQPLQVEQRTHLRVGVRHAEQQRRRTEPTARSDAGAADRHVAVVVASRSAPRSGCAGRAACPPERTARWLRVDHAGGVDLPGDQGAGRVALAADVVAVQADAHVEATHRDVVAGSQPRRPRGGRAGSAWPAESRSRPTATTRPARSATVHDRRVRPHHHDRGEVAGRCRASSSARTDRAGAPPPGARPAPRPAGSSRPRGSGRRRRSLDLALVVASSRTKSNVQAAAREPARGSLPRWSPPSGRRPPRPAERSARPSALGLVEQRQAR